MPIELKKAHDFETLSERYRELYENITGETFVKGDVSNMKRHIETNVLKYLNCAYLFV